MFKSLTALEISEAVFQASMDCKYGGYNNPYSDGPSGCQGVYDAYFESVEKITVKALVRIAA